MKHKRINRIELLRAINEWCAGRFNPLIGFPPKGGFPNIIYIFDDDYMKIREDCEALTHYIQRSVGNSVVVFTEPRNRATSMALTYKQWIESGRTMKATEILTGNHVYVLPVHDDNGNVVKYVSSEKPYEVNELRITGEVKDQS